MSVAGRISCRNFVDWNGYAYFSNWFYNGMFKVEIGTGNTTFLGHFEGDKLFEINIHKEIFRLDNKIFFCPRRGGNVHIYDLFEETMSSISIRKNNEKFFIIENAILEGGAIYLIPRQKEFSVRKLDLTSLKLTKENKTFDIQDLRLSENKMILSNPELIKKYHIKNANCFSWNQIGSKTWYGFLSMGSQLLKYTEERNEIEKIPLTVINETILENYLYKVREDILKMKLVSDYMLDLRDYFECVKIKESSNYNNCKNMDSVGKRIWVGNYRRR